ncbi:MAG: acyl dehydratase [Mycobacterium sp.]
MSRGGPTVSASSAPTPTRYFEQVTVGEKLPSVSFPLPIYRLVVAAGANRDFNSIHHNADYARATGAPDMYANVLFLLGMWERAVRDWIGDAGTMRAITGFRMNRFTTVTETAKVVAKVVDKRVADGAGIVTLRLHTEDSAGVTVGPGTVVVTLPRRDS